MGLGSSGLQFLLLAKRRGATFDRTLTLGRQNHFLDASWTKALFERFGLRITEAEAQQAVAHPYSEPLFRELGASVVDSADASDFEGATVIHDLNRPIPRRLEQRYTCVADFGTLEHVFNFPVALKSSIDMIAVGGYFISVTPANNFMGHGFYQFSPELFFRFLPANGFDQVEIYMVPYRWMPHLFRVADPAGVSDRVELVNAEPMHLGVIARKVRHIPETVMPIQSDYENQFWKGKDVARRSQVMPVDPHLAAAISDLRARVAAIASWPESLSPHFVAGFENALHYQVMDPTRD